MLVIPVADAVTAQRVAEPPEFIHNIEHNSLDPTRRDLQDFQGSTAEPCRSLAINLFSYFQQPLGILFGWESGGQ